MEWLEELAIALKVLEKLDEQDYGASAGFSEVKSKIEREIVETVRKCKGKLDGWS